MTTVTKEKPKEEVKTEVAPKTDRHLTKEERETLMKDNSVPEGYAKKPVEVKAEEEKEEKVEKAEKPAEKPAEAPKVEKKDFFERLETQLAKPEGKEDLNEFTPREKAYFYQMRRDRKLRQDAEEKLAKVQFEEAKKKQEEKKVEPAPKKTAIFDGRDPGDFVTVEEVQKAFEKAEEEKPKEDRTEKEDKAFQNMFQRFLRLSEKEAKLERPDFDAVMELSEDLISRVPENLNKVGEAMREGENPAIVMYDLIKSHKDFETLYPAAEVRAKARAANGNNTGAPSSVPAQTPEELAKAEKAKQAEKALEENTKKTKTTAHVSSVESKTEAGELSMEEISRMSPLQFAKLPKSVRNKYLEKYG